VSDRPAPDASAPTCAHCGDAFPTERLLALHRGRAHEAELGPTERTACEEAIEAESAALRLFRLKALGGVVLLYFGLLVTYALVA
jgi:hypothetical protein